MARPKGTTKAYLATRTPQRFIRADFSAPEWDPIWAYQREVCPESTIQAAMQELVRLGLATVKNDAMLVNTRIAAYRDLSRKLRMRMAIHLHEFARELEAPTGGGVIGERPRSASEIEGAVG